MAFADGWDQVCILNRTTLNRTYRLTAIISSGADFVFIPERPPKVDPWEDEMCEIIQKVYIAHRLLSSFFF